MAGETESATGTMLGSGAGAVQLLALLDDDPARTVVWSPLSVASAMALLWTGAAGRTAEELQQVVAPGRAATELAPIADAACREPVAGAELAAANLLWADSTLPVRAEYRDAVRAWPGGDVRNVDFAGDPGTARDTINASVREVTRGLIPELLGSDDVRAETLALLVSACWLRLRWERPFEPARTEPMAFEAPSGTRNVPMMSDIRRVPYARLERSGESWSMVSLAAGDVCCDVVLPQRPGQRLTDPDLLTELRANARPRMVDLQLPRVQVESRANLTDVLGRLGASRVFTDDAELSGVADARLKVDRVVHQAVLSIDEVGAQAAAATAASMVLAASARPEQPVPFHVRHPFLVLLRHRTTGVTYMLAQVREP